MQMQHAIPKLEALIVKANETQEPQEERFLNQELKSYDKIYSVFNWLFDNGVDFETKRTKDRFIVIIKPKAELT